MGHSVNHSVSVGLGLLSIISWFVAEIPQILTNYRQKSTKGLSIAFLLTWIVGDLFNLIGCKLEPSTLPTQYYTAVLYTLMTLVLTLQSLYYGHIYPRLKVKGQTQLNVEPSFRQCILDDKKTYIGSANGEKQLNLGGNLKDGSDDRQGTLVPSSPIPVATPGYSSSGRELYYISARSLSTSHTPVGSYLAQAFSQGRNIPISTDNQQTVQEPLLGAQSAPPSNTSTRSMFCVISATTFIFSSFSLHLSKNNQHNRFAEEPPQGVVIRIGRKLLQEHTISGYKNGGNNWIGTYLGWAMAAIYTGGRLPQICLNIKRGTVDGLNPLMFIFALVGNLSYVASILVSSVEWSKIRANLPWLVDAGGCVILDTCILIQFICYSKFRRPKLQA